MNKKGQSGGLVTGLVFGIASLVIGVIIAFVLVSTLTGSDLLSQESVSVADEYPTYANNTGYTLLGASDTGATGFVLTSAKNSSESVALTNFTVSSVGVVKNATAEHWGNLTLSYSYTRDTAEIKTTDSLSANFSEGINNISDKVPTLLLIGAIILIIGILAVLVGVWQKIRTGGQL